jgi:hypothetical protein
MMVTAAAFVASLAGSSPALADKLVIFKNGKAMRVKSVTKDGNWLKCEFDNNDFLSVPADRIGSIEDASGTLPASNTKINQVASGSGGGAYQPPPPANPAGEVMVPNMQAQNDGSGGEEPGDSDVQVVGQGQPQQGAARNRFGGSRVNRNTGRSNNINSARGPAGLPLGLQPLNTGALNPQQQQQQNARQNRGLSLHRSTVIPPPTNQPPQNDNTEDSDN